MIDATYTAIAGVVLTIRRPDGQVEDVVRTDYLGQVPGAVFEQMRQATRAAGRGELLGQRPHKVVRELAMETQRDLIAGPLADLAGAFPGSAEWQRGVALEAELAAFDAAHPDVIANIQAARSARTAAGVARMDNLAD